MKGLIWILFLLLSFNAFACEKEASWIDHYILAEQAVGDIKGQEAIYYFTKAIELNPDELFLYVQRGQIYMKMKDYEKAEQDFTRVINTENVHVSLLLPALRGRSGCYLRLDGNDCFPADMSRTDRFHLDFDRAEQIDPNKPYISENSQYKVLTNLSIEMNNPEFKKEYANLMVKMGQCESEEDVKFFANGSIVVKMKDSPDCCCGCKNVSEKKSSQESTQCCVGSGGILKGLIARNKNPTDETDCKYWCDRISDSAKGLCAENFESFKCQEICRQVVEETKRGCYWCCKGDGFYSNCVKPFETFLERVGCEEAIW